MTRQAQTRAQTNRMCDAALEHIQGVAEDMGLEQALNVYRAQTTAFIVLLTRELGSHDVAKLLVLSTVAGLLEGIGPGPGEALP